MIKIELKTYENALNIYNTNYLNRELDEYILEQAKYLPLSKINILITSNLTEEEQNNLKDLIHNYYKNKSKHLDKIDKYDNLIRLILITIGILILIISSFLTTIFSELFSIIAWVIIWEAVYDFIFEELKRKRKNSIYKKLSKCNIEFN